MKVLEVNDNDIYGKIFNGYTIMEELNKTSDFSINQLVINKLSDNPKCIRLFKDARMIQQEFCIVNLEKEVMSTQSLLSTSAIMLKKNQFYNDSELVHFHQVHNSKIPLSSFFKLAKNKPTVISLHDMWFMTGRCVQTYGCDKWMEGCKHCEFLNTIFEFTQDNCHELWKIKSKIADTDIDIIVHSKFMYDMVKQSPYMKDLRVHLVPLGVDISKFSFKMSKEEAKRKLNIFENDTVIMFRESNALKGTQYAVKALKKLKNKENITILTCDGKGFLKEIENQFNIIEMGMVDEEKMLECYNAADIFLMPSPGETFGMMAVEAMAAGLLTIVFDNTALPDTTGSPNIGVLAKNLDSDDLCSKLEYYIRNPKERIERVKKARKYVEKKYNYDAYIEKIKSIYKKAYEMQKYKIDNQYKENNFDIDYVEDNSKKVIKKLNVIYDKYAEIFGNEHRPDFLKKENMAGDDINYSDENVIKLTEKFNEFIYEDLLQNNQDKLIETIKKEDKKKKKKEKKEEKMCNMNTVSNIMKPKVSIIIPVYNGGKYVSMAIDSALRQTYDNIEIIVVNDGSTDDTEKICKSYGDKIKYIKKENGGVSTALNAAIKQMTGQYFSWLSHDDLYYPEKVEKEIKYLEENNLIGTDTILYSNFSLMDGDGHFQMDILFDSIIMNQDSVYSILKGGIDGLTLLIPKEAFDKVGLFDENLRCIQDYALWFEMYKKGYKFVHIPDVLAVTRIHAAQVTNTNPRVVTEGNEFWMNVIKYFSKEDMVRLFGSEYEFYYKMARFFYGGPYNEALSFCTEKYKNIEKAQNIQNIKVSVIIPFYNDIDSTIRAVESVISQTHENIEIILINNGSNEDITKIKEIVQYNPEKIIYIEMNNRRKKLFVWQEGINNSIGEYVVLFDQYSCMNKDRIKIQLEKMVSSGACISDTSFYSNYNNVSSLVDSGFESGFFAHKIINECYIRMSTVMFDKRILVENNVLKRQDYDYAEEICLILSIAIENRILGINKPLTTIYYRDDSVDMEEQLKSIIKCVCENKKFDAFPKDIKRLINRYLENIKERDNTKDYNELEKQARLEELDRYAYMQTDECREVEKLRKIYNRLLFKRKIPYYELDNNAIKNSKINVFYRKYIKKG